MSILRTPDERFLKLPEFDFAPHYVDIGDTHMHYVDEGGGARGLSNCEKLPRGFDASYPLCYSSDKYCPTIPPNFPHPSSHSR
ncbi:MAG: hypothetical protein OXG49_14995 [Chloroflexi bacterium]|nr:hypothetical protein [Chloroflexota bacterium]